MNAKIFRWTTGLAAIIGLGFCLGGCGDGEGQSAKLLSGQKKTSAQDERIQKLLQIRVWDNSDSKWTTITAEELVGSLPDAYRSTIDEVCATSESEAASNLSVALNYLKLARSLVPIQLIDQNSLPIYRVPAQEHTARVAMFYIARRAAYRAMAAASSLLTGNAVLDASCNDEGQWTGEQFVEIFSLAYDAYIDATNGAIDSTLIASDTLKARAPTERDGRIWQYSSSEFSRAAAAHLIGGGFVGWLDDDAYDPFCASSPLVPTERRALEMLRIAAPNPADIADPLVSIKSLIGGAQAAGDGGATPSSGTIVQRLAEFLQDPEFASSQNSLTTITNLSLDDFTAARDYLQREHNSLVRTNRTLPTAEGAPYSRYAGTASEPIALPDIAYAAGSRYRYWGYAADTIEDPDNSLEWEGLESLKYNSNPGLDEFNSQVSLSIKTSCRSWRPRSRGTPKASRRG